VGWKSNAIEVSRIKAVKQHYGITVNDILVTCTASALETINNRVACKHNSYSTPMQSIKLASTVRYVPIATTTTTTTTTIITITLLLLPLLPLL